LFGVTLGHFVTAFVLRVPVEELVVCTTRASIPEFSVNQEVRIGSAWAATGPRVIMTVKRRLGRFIMASHET
jgi:hypothetical protein